MTTFRHEYLRSVRIRQRQYQPAAHRPIPLRLAVWLYAVLLALLAALVLP